MHLAHDVAPMASFVPAPKKCASVNFFIARQKRKE